MAIELLGNGWMRMVDWMEVTESDTWREIRHPDHWEEDDPDDYETCPDCGADIESTIILEQPGIPTTLNLVQCYRCDFETVFKHRTIFRLTK